METCIQLYWMALENIEYQMRKCGFAEVLSTLLKFLLFLFVQSPKAGSTEYASWVSNLFISVPCFGSSLQMIKLSFSSAAGTAQGTASLSQIWYPDKLSNLLSSIGKCA